MAGFTQTITANLGMATNLQSRGGYWGGGGVAAGALVPHTSNKSTPFPVPQGGHGLGSAQYQAPGQGWAGSAGSGGFGNFTGQSMPTQPYHSGQRTPGFGIPTRAAIQPSPSLAATVTPVKQQQPMTSQYFSPVTTGQFSTQATQIPSSGSTTSLGSWVQPNQVDGGGLLSPTSSMASLQLMLSSPSVERSSQPTLSANCPTIQTTGVDGRFHSVSDDPGLSPMASGTYAPGNASPTKDQLLQAISALQGQVDALMEDKRGAHKIAASPSQGDASPSYPFGLPANPGATPPTYSKQITHIPPSNPPIRRHSYGASPRREEKKDLDGKAVDQHKSKPREADSSRPKSKAKGGGARESKGSAKAKGGGARGAQPQSSPRSRAKSADMHLSPPRRSSWKEDDGEEVVTSPHRIPNPAITSTSPPREHVRALPAAGQPKPNLSAWEIAAERSMRAQKKKEAAQGREQERERVDAMVSSSLAAKPSPPPNPAKKPKTPGPSEVYIERHVKKWGLGEEEAEAIAELREIFAGRSDKEFAKDLSVTPSPVQGMVSCFKSVEVQNKWAKRLSSLRSAE